MVRKYQYDYSSRQNSVYDCEARERKGQTTLAILKDYLSSSPQALDLLDVGASTGIIDHYLAKYFGSVTGIDIDATAIEYARKTWEAGNLTFAVGDALHLQFENERFDVVLCSHIYEHVIDPHRMFAEIYRVLKPGGICYFAAGNRLMFNEPHYHLPLLALLPRPVAHLYVRLAGKATHYHEKHLTFWELKNLVGEFKLTDYTLKTISSPEKFGIGYLVKRGSWKQKLAMFVLRHLPWASPGYIWILKKPAG